MWRTWGRTTAKWFEAAACGVSIKGDKREVAVEERWKETELFTVIPSRGAGPKRRVERLAVLHGGPAVGHGLCAGSPATVPHFSTPNPPPVAGPGEAEPPSSARPKRRLSGGPHSTRFGVPGKRAKRRLKREKRPLRAALWGCPKGAQRGRSPSRSKSLERVSAVAGSRSRRPEILVTA